MDRRESRSRSREERRRRWEADQAFMRRHEANRKRKIAEFEENWKKAQDAQDLLRKISHQVSEFKKNIRPMISQGSRRERSMSHHGEGSESIRRRQASTRQTTSEVRSERQDRQFSFGERSKSRSPQPSTSRYRPRSPPSNIKHTHSSRNQPTASSSRHLSTTRIDHSPTSRTRRRSRGSRSLTPPRHSRTREHRRSRSSNRDTRHKRERSREYPDQTRHSMQDDRSRRVYSPLPRNHDYGTSSRDSCYTRGRIHEHRERQHQSPNRPSSSSRQVQLHQTPPERHWNHPSSVLGRSSDMPPVQIVYVTDPMQYRFAAPYMYPQIDPMREPFLSPYGMSYPPRFGPRGPRNYGPPRNPNFFQRRPR